jgi:hypothetical protein
LFGSVLLALSSCPLAAADDAQMSRQADHSLAEALANRDGKAVAALLDERVLCAVVTSKLAPGAVADILRTAAAMKEPARLPSEQRLSRSLTIVVSITSRRRRTTIVLSS